MPDLQQPARTAEEQLAETQQKLDAFMAAKQQKKNKGKK